MAQADRITRSDLSDDEASLDHRPAGLVLESRSGRIHSFERDYLVELLERVRGDVAEACKVAALPRSTFYRLLKKHDLRAGDFR